MWIYQQSTGKLWKRDGSFVIEGYAGGDQGKAPEGVNNGAMQSVANIGPLPHGIYTMSTPIEHSQLGPYAIPLQPDPDNEMYGRRGFYMHGDTKEMNHSASDGCIIMPLSIRVSCWSSGDHLLTVIE